MSRLKGILQEFSGRQVCLLAIFYVLGIVGGRCWVEGQAALYVVVGITLLIIFAALLLQELDLFKAVLLLMVFVSGGVAFYFNVQYSTASVLNYSGDSLRVTGTVIEEPVFYDNRDVYHLQVELVETADCSSRASGKLLVNVYGSSEENESYRYGDSLLLRGTVNEPRGLRNPGGFDYRFFLKSRGIDAVINVQPSQVSLLEESDVNSVAAAAVNMRNSMTTFITEELPFPAGEMMAAMLFGQRQHLPEEIEENFRRAGTGHLLAVSGLHVGLVAALILGLSKLLGLHGRLPLILAIILVFVYAYLTGLRPSALRAAIMVSFALGALLLDRERDLLTAVAVAALLTLFFNPLLLFDLGFQLSYAATLSLVYAYRPLEHILKSAKCPRMLCSPIAVTLAAQVGVLPLCVYYFQHLPTGALLFNLLLLPFIIFTVGLGLSGALVGLFLPLAGSYLLWAAYPLLELMALIIEISALPGFYLALNPPGSAALIVYYTSITGVLATYYFWLNHNRDEFKLSYPAYIKKGLLSLFPAGKGRAHLLIGIAIFPIVLAVWSNLLFPSGQNLRVTFIDVGQGAAALVETPCEATIMVDAGGELPFYGEPGEIGERVILPFLRYRRINEIDLAVVTHPHEDHFGGFLPVIGQIPIKHMLISPAPGETVYYEQMLESAEKNEIPVTGVTAGEVWSCGPDLTLEMLGPPEKLYRGTGSDLNNNSIVFLLKYKEIKLLFTGDIEDSAAKDLLRRKVDLRADFLQVPHHGGYMEVMPDFLEAVKPEAAVIQVGPNPFGHPHPHVISSLEEAGIMIFRNDRHGAVIVETCGEDMDIWITEQPALVN